MSDYLPDCHLSRCLCDILEKVGGSEEMRNVHQNVGITLEIIENIISILKKENISDFNIGSYCEGTTPGLHSDIDILVCNEDYPVIEDIRDATGGLSLLVVRDSHTHPGYVKLQAVDNGIPLTIYNSVIIPDFELDHHGRILKVPYRSYVIREQNGPRHTNTNSLLSYFCYGYRCSTIPAFAREWIQRRRNNDWPSGQLVKKMSTSGWFFVGVGNPSSHESHLEWRLSFSLQERELMFSLNPWQYKCYIILKMIKKDLIETVVGKYISSYHCKTCLFYVIENTGADIWRSDNLIECIRLCLFTLMVYVRDGNCPDYFIKQDNLFDTTMKVNADLRFRVTFLLFALIKDIHHFLFQLKCDNIGYLLMKMMDVGNFQINNALAAAAIDHEFNMKLNMIRHLCYLRFEMNAICQNDAGNSYSSYLKMLSILKATKSVRDHTEQQTQEAKSYLIPHLHVQLAKSSASLAFRLRTIPIGRTLLKTTYIHLQKGQNSDLTSSALVRASILYRDCQYENCVNILDVIERDITPSSASFCGCPHSLYVRTFYETFTHQFHSKSVLQIMTNIATCVAFRKSDKSITPDPLCYEMFRSVDTPLRSRNKEDDWFDSAVIDGKIYLYVLKYLANYKLDKPKKKKYAIYTLKRVLQTDKNLGHRETAYNILGWICVQEGNVQEGFEWFMESWRIRPLHNAVKWHLCTLVFNLMHGN